MSKAETTAAVAASIKRVASDAAATGAAPSPEFTGAMMRAGVVRVARGGDVVTDAPRDGDFIRASFGKRLHRRGWCSL